jgi:hypothetical protein
MRRMSVLRTSSIVLALWLVASGAAHPQIVKCRNAAGQTTYTEQKCPADTSPVDLPGDLPSKPLGNYSADTAQPDDTRLPALSPRAVALEPEVMECHRSASTPRCNGYQQLMRLCSDSAQWSSPDCRALRELIPRASAARDGEWLAEMKPRCDAGSKSACYQLLCPRNMREEQGTARILECSRRQNLRRAAAWAQVREETDAEGNWRGDFVCLASHSSRSSVGLLSVRRAEVRVQFEYDGQRRTGRYASREIPQKSFATIESAADAACLQQNASLEAAAKLLRPTPAP